MPGFFSQGLSSRPGSTSVRRRSSLKRHHTRPSFRPIHSLSCSSTAGGGGGGDGSTFSNSMEDSTSHSTHCGGNFNHNTSKRQRGRLGGLGAGGGGHHAANTNLFALLGGSGGSGNGGDYNDYMSTVSHRTPTTTMTTTTSTNPSTTHTNSTLDRHVLSGHAFDEVDSFQIDATRTNSTRSLHHNHVREVSADWGYFVDYADRGL